MTRVQDAYIAGFFDGEGHVIPKGRRTSGGLSFSQKDRAILDWILHLYPGGRFQKQQSGVWVLQYNGRKGVDIAKAIRPYLLGKALEVDIYLIDNASAD